MAVLNEINFGIHKIESMFFNNHKVHDVFYGIHHIWTEASTGIISILKSVWADEYGSKSNTGVVFILYQPTVTHSFTSMRGLSTNVSTINSYACIVELTDNNDNTFTMNKYVYYDGSQAADCIDSGLVDTDNNELYYFSSTYNSSKTLNSWTGQFEAGKSYALSVIKLYSEVDYRIATGTKTALVGSTGCYYDWPLANNALSTLKKSATGIYGEIIQ